ncbi:MAG TPA: HlyD family efflux transporter periplasmic adaptor subunit [Anaerohalosphaeraceae bacterium]|nr:HlyD family efflux transporter periplasmic adaptor subunit [Anaerohalosphaeraceae bacterium]
MLPVLVWLAAVGAVCFLFVYRNSRFTTVGIADAQTCVFTAPDSGWLISMPVHLYQQVHQGQPLAVLRLVPPAEIERTRAQVEAEKAAVLAELEYRKIQVEQMLRQLAGDQSREQMEQLYREHQVALDAEKTRLLILEIQSRLEPARIQLKDLETEKKVLENLLAKKAIEPYELQKVTVQAEALAAQIAQDERQLVEARQDLEAIQSRLEAFRASSRFSSEQMLSLEPLQKAIALQEKRLEELSAIDFDVVLEAPFDGIVASIGCAVGQTVSKDMPILTLAAPSADFVTAWVPQEQSGSVTLHQPVEIIKMSSPRKVLRSEVAEMGPMVELMPERLWKNPSIPEWGRPVRIPVHPEMQLIPNELVGIRGI